MKAKRNLLALLLTVVMLWQGFSVVHAENTSSVATASNLPQSGLPEATGASPSGNGHERQDVITDVRMTLNDQPINENTEIYADSVFALNVKLAVKGKAVNGGEYVDIQLPSALSAKDENTPLKAGNVTIANAHYDSGSKTLRITFTGDAASYSGADGEYKFYVRVNSSKVSTAQKIPMEIKVGGVSLFSLNMNYKGVGMDEEPNFWKNYGGDIETYVDKDGVKHFLIHFFIQINGRRIGTVSDKYTDVKIHDQLVSSVLTYVDPTYPELSMNWANPSDADRFTPKLVRGVWKSGERDSAGFHPVADGAPRGHKWALQDLTNSSNPAPVRNIFSLRYKEGKRAFDYDLKDLNKEEGAELQYFVEVHELPKNGSKYYNEASLTANQIETKLHNREVTVQASEGRFDVKPYILRIEKKNKEGAPLSGAKFTIRDTKTNIEKTVVTGADGIATWDNALLSEYEIKEIEPPVGYVRNDASQTVTEEELRRASGAEKPMVTKTFINEKPNDPEPNKPSDPKPNDPEPNKPNNPKPSDPVPSNPGGGGNTPGNPGGGSGNPRVPGGNTPGNPGDNGGTTPPPTTNNPGEVLGASRPEVNETVKPGEVLGESRPAVRGRAAVATDDKSAMKLYAVLFMLSAVSFIGFSLYRVFPLWKKEREKKTKN